MTTDHGPGDPEPTRLGLFEGFGVEIELMIVDRESLDVKPVCDRLIASVAGRPVSEVDLGDVSWSNELTLHVLELKTNGPALSLSGLAGRFHDSLGVAQERLAALDARLMPGAMHPWMDPNVETRLWPHEYNDVYRAFDRIFGCSGHGWANLQSTHLNLPFDGDEEFGRLHAACRIVLPLIPGLAASSPFQDGGLGPGVDGRIVAYRSNARLVPSVAGQLVPEAVFTRLQYEREILGRLYDDLAPHDPNGVLRFEWANARGAIARFERGAIEIRLVDAQECPLADLAVIAAVVGVVRALTTGPLADRQVTLDPATESLARLLTQATIQGERAVVDDRRLLTILGLGPDPVRLGRLWDHLLDTFPPDDPSGEWTGHLEIIQREGPLARRMMRAAGEAPGKDDLVRVATGLCSSLTKNASFSVVA